MSLLSQLVTRTEGNTKSSVRARKWCFTLNNYSVEECDTLSQYFIEKKWKYIIGKEVGENQTPHLQGYFESRNAIRFDTLKNLNSRWHLEKAKGSLEENFRYCSKDNDFTTNIEGVIDLKDTILKIEYKDVVWKEWQAFVLNILNNEVDKRAIYWFWEPLGNTGKSYLTKYIALTKDCVIASGKTIDIFNQIKLWRDNNKSTAQLPVVIIDNPRSLYNHINYAALESLKNGFIYSGKYEGGQVIGLNPHIVVFANSPPNYSELSQDRFRVFRLDETEPLSLSLTPSVGLTGLPSPP